MNSGLRSSSETRAQSKRRRARRVAILAGASAAIVALTFAGCHTGRLTDPAGSAEFVLGVGEHRNVARPPLAIGFVGVASDSRCPKDVTCVWAGEAQVVTWIHPAGGDTTQIPITIPAAESISVVVEGARVTVLALEPYPQGPGPIPPRAYRLRLRVVPAAE